MNDIRATFDPGLPPDGMTRLVTELRQRMQRGARRGAEQAAVAMEATAQATSAYHGQSGATRAGTVFYVADASDDGSSAFGAAYAAAAAHLSGFTGHSGSVARVATEPPPAGGLSIIGTVPTDYIDELEFDNAGEKAFLGPTLVQKALAATIAIAQGIKEEIER